MSDKTDTETHGITEFLDNLDDMLPSMVWALIDVIVGALALSVAWEGFGEGQWVITIVAALAGVYLFVIAFDRLLREYRGDG